MATPVTVIQSKNRYLLELLGFENKGIRGLSKRQKPLIQRYSVTCQKIQAFKRQTDVTEVKVNLFLCFLKYSVMKEQGGLKA
jgi:hypothetical protein